MSSRQHARGPTGDADTPAGQRGWWLVDLLPLAVICLDADGCAVYVNAGWAEITGRPATAHLGDGWLADISPDARAAAASWVRTALSEQRALAGDVPMRTASGQRLLRLAGRPHHDSAGRLRFYVLSGADVTDQLAREARLVHAASHDALTGLSNRAELLRLAAVLASDASRAGGGVAALFLDLDDFKTVNDEGGHSLGDALLRAVGGRLRAAVRPPDVVGRYGGDEFGVLLVDVTDVDEAGAIAGRVLEAVRQPVDLHGRRVVVHGSVGIALTRDDRVRELFERADAALYAAKAQGKGRIVVAADHRQPRRESVSGPFRAVAPAPAVAPGGRSFHAVHFYDDAADLVPAVAGYVSAGLFEDHVTVVATPEHREAINSSLNAAWVDAARAENRYIELDAEETLARFMRDGMPDVDLLRSVASTMVHGFAGRAPVRAYGEMVGLLWERKQLTAALALEDMWNAVQRQRAVPLLCAYQRSSIDDLGDGLQQVCSRHTQVLTAG